MRITIVGSLSPTYVLDVPNVSSANIELSDTKLIDSNALTQAKLFKINNQVTLVSVLGIDPMRYRVINNLVASGIDYKIESIKRKFSDFNVQLIGGVNIKANSNDINTLMSKAHFNSCLNIFKSSSYIILNCDVNITNALEVLKEVKNSNKKIKIIATSFNGIFNVPSNLLKLIDVLALNSEYLQNITASKESSIQNNIIMLKELACNVMIYENNIFSFYTKHPISYSKVTELNEDNLNFNEFLIKYLEYFYG